jgi:hypothetical protein
MAWAQATTTTTVNEIPFSAVVSDCGATIQISGTVHALYHVTQSPNSILINSEFNPQGVTGTDQNGVLYQGTGASRENFNFAVGEPLREQTIINRFLMISRGSTPNLYIVTTSHLTYANGEVRVSFSNSSVECRPPV